MLNLTVQGQKRFFILTKNALAYKTNESDAAFKEAYTTVLGAEIGASPTSLLVTVKENDVMALTASSAEEAQTWLKAIQQVLIDRSESAEVGAKLEPIPLAAPLSDEPTIQESQLGEESTVVESSVVAVEEPKLVPVSSEAGVILTPPPAKSSWFWASCCAAE